MSCLLQLVPVTNHMNACLPYRVSIDVAAAHLSPAVVHLMDHCFSTRRTVRRTNSTIPTGIIVPVDFTSMVKSSHSGVWSESKTPWATRWDNYLRVYDPKIHTFSL